MTTRSSSAFDQLQTEINAWAEGLLGNYAEHARSDPPKEAKIIRDAVHGYQSIWPWEVVLIDSPIVQRLHFIHQTGLSYLVYPSANHTRFEHSLGVCYMVSALARSARERGLEDLFGKDLFEELRIAALLHDIGHSFFSHLSEVLLEDLFPIFEEIRTERSIRSKAGEILSYMIVQSPAVRELLQFCMEHYHHNWNIDRIAGLIIGAAPRDSAGAAMEQYLADMLNGPFDADKMDYLLRDSHVTGIRGDVDVQRLMYAFTVFSEAPSVRRMAMDQSGVPVLEQILFSKMQLYTAMYHHHKVRAIECMVKGIFEVIGDHRDQLENSALGFRTVADFLNMDDVRFIGAALEEPLLKDRIEQILKRNLLKRVLHISRRSVVGEGSGAGTRNALDELLTIRDNPANVRDLRQVILDAVPEVYRTNLADLWVDLPVGPTLSGEASRCDVVFGSQKNAPSAKLNSLFPLDRWLESYEQNKWSGHVFYVDDLAHRRAANTAAREVFENWPGLHFRDSATESCKLPL